MSEKHWTIIFLVWLVIWTIAIGGYMLKHPDRYQKPISHQPTKLTINGFGFPQVVPDIDKTGR